VSERDRSALHDANRRVKRWPGWLLLGIVAVALLAVGATRTSGPATQDERVEAITKRVACPICDGESVFESRNNASLDIRNQVTELVRANELDDDQIVGFIETRYGADALLVPKASGFDALVWVLPAIAFVCGVVGLAIAFRRWRSDATATPHATDADRALVEAALVGERTGDERWDGPGDAPGDDAGDRSGPA
jgi:cytochrome c-type biogenesis protein CcmH